MRTTGRNRMAALIVAIAVIAVAGVLPAAAQQGGVDAPSGKSLSATMNVYVFPKAGQDGAQQTTDEASCYEWAVGNVGTDPFELSKRSQQSEAQKQKEMEQAKKAGKGAGARGAVRGAAAGALIGEIASDDAGSGAAYGAAAGVIAGRRSRARSQQQAQQSVQQSAQQRQQATAEQLLNFKKAFSVCLEAKDYLVKY